MLTVKARVFHRRGPNADPSPHPPRQRPPGVDLRTNHGYEIRTYGGD